MHDMMYNITRGKKIRARCKMSSYLAILEKVMHGRVHNCQACSTTTAAAACTRMLDTHPAGGWRKRLHATPP